MRKLKIFALYLTLSVIFTWPLILHFNTHLIGNGWDGPAQAWNFWWLKFSLFNLHQSPLSTNYIFYPQEISLITHSVDYLNGFLFMPLQSFLNVTATTNLSIIFSIALQGFFTYLLIHKLTHSFWASLFGGIAFAFSPFNFAHLTSGHYTLGSAWIVPAAVLALVNLGSEKGRKVIFLAGLAIGATFYLNFIYAAYLALLAAISLVYWIVVKPTGKFLILKNYLLAGIISLILASPLLIPSLNHYRTGNFVKVELWSTEMFSVTPLTYLVPSQLHPLWGKTIDRIKSFSAEQTVFPGISVLLLAGLAIGVGRKKDQRNQAFSLFLLLLIIFGTLSLGPRLRLRGRNIFTVAGKSYSLWLPYAVFHQLPVLGLTKEPGRVGITTTLCLAVLAGYGFSYLERRARKPMGILLVGILLFELLPVPLKLFDAQPPKIYEKIGQDNEDYAILNLPLGWSSSMQYLGFYEFATQYHQVTHHKKVFEGFASQQPKEVFGFYNTVPVIRYLYNPSQRPLSPEDKNKAEALKELAKLKVRYIIVDKTLATRIDLTNIFRDYLENVLELRPTAEDQQTIVYRL